MLYVSEKYFNNENVTIYANISPLSHRAQDVLDVYVLFDAIATCISSEEKDLCKIGQVALGMVIDTAATIVGDREKASELLLFEVVADKVCGCCYERAWYAKNGG